MSNEYENIKSTWSEKFVEENIKSTWIKKFVEGNIKGNTFVDYNNLNNMQMDSRVHDWSIMYTPMLYRCQISAWGKNPRFRYYTQGFTREETLNWSSSFVCQTR